MLTTLFLRPTAAVIACAVALVVGRPDRRVVDVVDVGNAQSDAAHGYDGSDVHVGTVDGKPYRETRGWIHYALTTFDDTEVTLQCTFVSPDARSAASGATAPVSRRVDVIVEDSLLATPTVAVSPDAPTRIDVTVPFRLTKGKTRIVVVLRARDGVSPALRELRTIQDHYEDWLAPRDGRHVAAHHELRFPYFPSAEVVR